VTPGSRARGVPLALITLLVLCVRFAVAAPSVVVAVGARSPLGLPFSRFSDVALDDRGRLAFIGTSAAIFRRTPAGLVHLAGAGDTLGGRAVAGVGTPALGAGDCLAFRAVYVDGVVGVLRRCGTTLAQVAEVGQPAAGGGVFTGFGAAVVTGAGGRVAFTALVDDGRTGVFVGDGATPAAQVARTGGQAPTGGTFSGFRLVGVAADGSVGFRGTVSGGHDGLFAWNTTAVAAVAVVGDASPAGGAFTALNGATLNDAGSWAFRGRVSAGGDSSGVFRFDPGQATPRVVAIEGVPAPGGGTLRSFPTSLVPAINTDGAIVFRAALGGAVASAGVFVAAPDGSLVRVLGVGETTGVGLLLRLRDPVLADDGGVVVRAALADGTPGLFRIRAGTVTAAALLGDATDLGGRFRFSDAAVRETADGAVFAGVREAVFVAGTGGAPVAVAVLGDPTPLRGRYAGFEPPAAGARGRIVFGASIQGGRAGEALFGVGRRRAVPLVRTGARVGHRVHLLDLFADPLDGATRAASGPAGLAFQGALDHPSGTSAVLLGGRGLRVVVREGQTAVAGGRFAGFGTPALSGDGGVAFVGQMSGGNADLGVFLARGTRVKTLALAGRQTGTRVGGRFDRFGPPAAGGDAVVFDATLQPTGEALFASRRGRLAVLVAVGDPAPGGGRFHGFDAPTIVGKTVVFRATLSGGSVPGGLFRVALPRAEPAPAASAVLVVGAPSPFGGTLLGFGLPDGNRRGAIAFTADVTGGTAAGGVLLDPGS
jgi:hypothetical protein